MTLSPNSAVVLEDLVANKLASLCIDDREDLREMMTLQRCLQELKSIHTGEALPEALQSFQKNEIPRRGRHRKLSDMMG